MLIWIRAVTAARVVAVLNVDRWCYELDATPSGLPTDFFDTCSTLPTITLNPQVDMPAHKLNRRAPIVSISLPPELHDFIEGYRVKHDISRSAAIAVAIKRMKQREDAKNG